jgi:predicted permease
MAMTMILGIFFVFMIFSSSLIGFAFAQNDVTAQDDSIRTVEELDGLLSTTVTATLTGLSLAGATFLVRTFKDEENETKLHTHKAQKNFIKAFLMFLVCTIFIFIFDFLEILGKEPNIYVLFLDLIITYGFFGVGIMYLIKSAKEMYIMFGR